MVVLVPWKPVALVLRLRSALILVSYFGSDLAPGKDRFAVSTGIRNRCIKRVLQHDPV
jgi:hypothetical protein